MKTSKIILVGFLSITGLFMLSLIIQVDKNKIQSEFILNKKAITLPSFSHLVLINSDKVTLFQADNDSAKMHYDMNTEAVLPDFELKNDTLIIRWPVSQNAKNRSIYCSAIKTVRIENSSLNIKKFNGDSLWIYANSGKADINLISRNAYVSLYLTANSFVNIHGSQIGTVDANLDFSTLKFRTKQLAELNAILADSSNLFTQNVLYSNVRTDENSRFITE
jgi:hypothetical protein